MKKSIKELVKKCAIHCNLTGILIDLNNHINNVNNTNNEIVFNYYNDSQEFLKELNKLSLDELEEFVDKLEDELVKQVLKLVDSSLFEKLYDAGI